MTAPSRAPRGTLGELARFLEIQNLGLNLPFALAFLWVASAGLPTMRTGLLVVAAFVAARNAGHAFNRWVDRDLDAQNPRTLGRALVTGRFTPGFALALVALHTAILCVAAFLLNPLALLLVPVALGLVLGYSYTKRVSPLTTVFLGLVEAITPAAVFVAVTGGLPPLALVATAGMGAWGTAFETIHSLGDMESDLRSGTYSLPLSLGRRRSARLVPALHGAALLLFGGFGFLAHLAYPFFVGLVAMVVLVALIDAGLAGSSADTGRSFRFHFALSAIFLLGVILSELH